MQPPEAVLNAFGIKLVTFLGGRLNQHWQVERQGQALVLRRWATALPDIEFDREVRLHVEALGWPIAPDVSDLLAWTGAYWSLAPLLPGQPWPPGDAQAEQRMRGVLLAEFHQSVKSLKTLPQRPGWRRAEDILSDPTLEQVFQTHANRAEAHLLLWHLRCARQLAADLPLHRGHNQLLHGDCISQNLLYQDGKLSGLLDFELSHLNHRVAEFCLAWRGAYDQVICSYNEVSPLDDLEWNMLTPIWWAYLLEGAYHDLSQGVQDDGWTIKMLLRRSPLMAQLGIPAYVDRD